jgi:hypothetical protein
MAWGVVLALRELGGLYQGVLTDPLGQPEGTEQNAASGMKRGVLIGAAGVPPFLAGTIMLKAARRRRRLTGR